MAGFPIQLPDGSTVNIVHKDGGEGINERFTAENGDVYMRQANSGLSKHFLLVEGKGPALNDEDQTEPLTESVSGARPEFAEDEPDGGEVYEGPDLQEQLEEADRLELEDEFEDEDEDEDGDLIEVQFTDRKSVV